jgi:surfactin synthase thioesterase subunit
MADLVALFCLPFADGSSLAYAAVGAAPRAAMGVCQTS